MVYLNEVTDLMDKMMRVEIFRPSEKLRMLKDEEKVFPDPNLIMDARHRILHEDVNASLTKSSIFAEAKRSVEEQEARELYTKREQEFLEKELKKFTMELQKSRPKFSAPYSCSRRIFAASDDEEFWGVSRRIKEKITEKNDTSHERNADVAWKINEKIAVIDVSFEAENTMKSSRISELPYTGNIKVTIKDKSNNRSEEERLSILKNCLDALKLNAKNERRFREFRIEIEKKEHSRITRKYFDAWRTYVENTRSVARSIKEEREKADERKIELFINAITEKQKALMRDRKSKPSGSNSIVGKPCSTEIKRENICSKRITLESPAQSRLNAQKRIIEKQRAKLAEQNRIIEELRLKETQKEISKAGRETIHLAKETLTNCTRQNKRNLIQLMRQAGYRDESLNAPQRAPSPPKFLKRMEARAEARKERIKLAEEARRKKLEEQKRKEEADRVEKEEERRRLLQEAQCEARRLRDEKERNRLREIEKWKKLNQTADDFYRKYLLRRYVIEPLMILVEKKNNNIKKANDHFKRSLTRKAFSGWRKEIEDRHRMRNETVVRFYNRKLLSRTFVEWKRIVKEENMKVQVARDFYDMKLIDRYFKFWQITTLELKVQFERKKKIAEIHYESKLMSRYFVAWTKYPEIVAGIKESEKRKDELRQIVQTVIPDFDPKLRGVTIED